MGRGVTVQNGGAGTIKEQSRGRTSTLVVRLQVVTA